MISIFKTSARGLLNGSNVLRISEKKGLLNEVNHSLLIPCATLVNLKPFETFDDVTVPEKPKLKVYNKVPKNTRYRKTFRQLIQIRGPALTANKLNLGQYGIVAKSGGYLRFGHFEMIRLTINRFIDPDRMYARWRVPPPSKPITKKGQGQRMGGGKANVDHYVTPVRAGRVIVEVAGKMEFSEIKPVLEQVSKKLPFRSEVVTAEYMKRRHLLEKEKVENNANPWTFQKIADGNYLGIANRLGPYDYKWYGEFR